MTDALGYVWTAILLVVIAWWFGAFERTHSDPVYILRRTLNHLWAQNERMKAEDRNNGAVLDAVKVIIGALERIESDRKAPHRSAMP